MAASSTTTERREPTEIYGGQGLCAVAFSTNYEHLMGGNEEGVRVWRAEDGTEVARMEAKDVQCLAVSHDGRSIAAGTLWGQVIVWDAETYEKIIEIEHDAYTVRGVDFSPDSARLVSASNNCQASVWDIATRKQVQTLSHESPVTAAKYSPQGDRIATATHQGSVRVYDSSDGRLLVDIKATVTPWLGTGLLWFNNNHLLVVSDSKIKRFEASTGSVVSEWPVPDSNKSSCIALPKHGKFVACSTRRTVTLWDTLTHTQLTPIERPQDIDSIAVSPDDRFIAIGGEDGKIIVASARQQGQQDQQPSASGRHDDNSSDSTPKDPRIAVSVPHPTLQEPDLNIDNVAVDLWKRDQLTDVETLLTTAIATSQSTSNHVLASRALVRARLQEWDTALVDAEKAIKIQPSVIGYIAKSIALVGKGERDKGYRTCDIAFAPYHSSHACFLLLIKAIIVFIAGEHPDAISRIDDLISTVPSNSICHAVQTYMYLLIGNSHMESSNYDGAIESFRDALARMPDESSQPYGPYLTISLICGWRFDNLGTTIQQHLCEALYAAGRTKEAGESLLELVNNFGSGADISGAIIKWVSDFTHRYLSAPESDCDAALNSPTPTLLLREWAKATLTSGKWKDALVAAACFTLPRVAIYRVTCERLEEMNRVTDAIECFNEMTSELGEDLYMSRSMSEWVSGFTQRRLSAPESNGDTGLNANPTSLLREWAKSKLTHESWKDALLSAADFALPRAAIYWVICERLETIDSGMDAVECFHRMTSEMDGETNHHDEHLKWSSEFRQRFPKKLEHLGDTAVDAGRHDEAISHYTTALSLNPPSPQGILIKRGKAFAVMGVWNQALDDANQVILLDPSSPWGYEMKHAALHKAGEYDDAVDAFEAMLSKIAQSPDPDIQQQGDQYISPSSTRATIRKIVQRTIRRSPRVLIDTTTGRLHDKAGQASSFEFLPIFNELVSSTTTRIDYVRIKREVQQYFRYVMLSHKWEENEPLFQQMIHTTVYDLEQSPTHDKLQMFCNIVRDAGFKWAWSDTCCINKSDHFVLQEALVVMFKWYQGSALTIVFLRGVRSWSQLGALVESIWNTRAWTLQEYVASKVIHFYTEDWTLYLDLQLPNHKESLQVISEMEKATGVSAEQLMALRPGLTSVREKLRLASTRQTTLVEDAAYSLLGIFSVAGLPAIYGEGEGSLGRLLAHVLAGSGDVSILAWIGDSGSFNSCLPAYVTVFNGPPASHLPPPVLDTEMESIVAASYSSSFDLEVALSLYDRLSELPSPWFAASRMKLPCIAFLLPALSPYRTRSGYLYRTDTPAFGTVEIRTKHNLSRMKSLYLVHPWLDSLLEEEDMHSNVLAEDDVAPPPSPNRDDENIPDEELDDDSFDDISSVPEPQLPSHPTPVHNTVPMDTETCARRLVARLRQPFGALLVTPAATSRRRIDYRRVAADSLITVRFQEDVSLVDILDNVRTLDVL